jgi:hypothetical protein
MVPFLFYQMKDVVGLLKGLTDVIPPRIGASSRRKFYIVEDKDYMSNYSFASAVVWCRGNLETVAMGRLIGGARRW